MVSVKIFELNFHNLFMFELDSAMDEHSKKHVRTTLQKLHADLDKCIRFSDFQGKKGKIYFTRFEETNEGDRVLVKSEDGKGCFSMVGQTGGPQRMNLQKSGKNNLAELGRCDSYQ